MKSLYIMVLLAGGLASCSTTAEKRGIASAESVTIWPLSPYYGSYKILSCKEMTSNSSPLCPYKYLTVSRGSTFQDGAPVPSATLRFANDLKTGGFYETTIFLYKDNPNNSYSEIGDLAQYQQLGIKDQNGNRANTFVQFSKEQSSNSKLLHKIEKISPNETSSVAETLLELQKL